MAILKGLVILVSLLIGFGEAQEAHQCGGFAGITCPEGYVCVDQPNDGCGDRGDVAAGSDCMGFCQVKVDCNADQACGTELQCVDDPGDSCDPMNGDRNCPTFCEFETPCDPMVACAEIWQPVCASNGITYSNDCFLDAARCIDPRMEKRLDSECPGGRVCNAMYRPVCGSNMKTYENECMWENAHDVDSSIEKVADMSCEQFRTSQASSQAGSRSTGRMGSSSRIGLILGLVGGFIILATFGFIVARRYLLKKRSRTQTTSSDIPQSAQYAEMDDSVDETVR